MMNIFNLLSLLKYSLTKIQVSYRGSHHTYKNSQHIRKKFMNIIYNVHVVLI